MCIYCIYSSALFVSFHSRGIYEVVDVLDDDTDNHVQEYEEVEIVVKSVEPSQRSASGRVYTGNDCEYIKLGSITANDGCTDVTNGKKFASCSSYTEVTANVDCKVRRFEGIWGDFYRFCI